MTFIDGIILGIIQGLAEFLPISSSGHLVLGQKFLGIQEHSLELDIATHVGTFFSILTFFYKDILFLLKGLLETIKTRKVTPGYQILFLIIIGSVPTAMMGLLFRDLFKSFFSNLTAVGFFLCLTGALLYLVKLKSPPSSEFETKNSLNLDSNDKLDSRTIDIKPWQALIIGIAQGLAIAPGISRSGSTIATALFCGVSKSSASRFSFLLSLPAVAGAALLELRDVSNETHIPVLLTGAVTAYFVGLLGLYLIVKLVNQGRIHLFSYYLVTIGLLTLSFSLF